MESSNNGQDCLAATGFSKNAPDGVISSATREPPLMPYFFRNGVGIVTRPASKTSLGSSARFS